MGGTDRNVVLVTVDSLRADHCGFVNPESDLTPTIDRLAAEGASFPQTIAPGPRTPSSAPVLFTGEFMPDDENWAMEDWQRRQRRIRRHMSRFDPLGTRLKRRGYETVAFTANPWTTRETDFHVGFDEFCEISAASDDVSTDHLSKSPLFRLADAGFGTLPGDPFNWTWKREWFSQWTGYFELLREQLADLSEPFFLWIFLMDAHQPYITPRQFREESAAWEMYYSVVRYWRGEVADEDVPPHARERIAQAYRDAVRSVDAFVAALEDEIDPYDPVTVLAADHGEALGEHGNFSHQQTLYEENLRVPCLVHDAGSSATVDGQLPLRALPDVLSAVAADDFDPREHTRPFVISKTEDNGTLSVRTPQWKYVEDGDGAVLYDLQMNPEETTDVRETHPDVTSSLSALLNRHLATQAEKARVNDAAANLADDTPI